MTFDAKWVFYLGIVVTLEQAIAGGTVSLTNAIPADWIPYVEAWAKILAFTGTAIMTAMSGYSSAKPGPLTQATPGVGSSPPRTTGLMLVLAVGLALSLSVTHARAQQAPKIGGPVGRVLDRLDDKGGAGGAVAQGATSVLDKPFADLANFIGDDIDSAIALSTSIPNLQDGTGQRCLMALKTFGDVIKAHPAPLTFRIANDLEAFRLKQAAINRLCESQECTTVFSDFTQVVTAISPVPLPVPNVHDLCAKVPRVNLGEAPLPVPATPVPTPPASVPPASPAVKP